MIIVQVYAVYLAVTIALTIWVGRTLFKNGKVFLFEVFVGDEDLASSVNHLLVVGFYLLNLGFASLNLAMEGQINDWRIGIESLSQKLGVVLLVLGGMHFLNLVIFSKVRSRQIALKQKEKWMDRMGVVGDVPRTART
jgi:hypothetical protein